MRITRNQLRQIIREELVREAYGDQAYKSYFLLRRLADWALRSYMGMAGNARMGDRERMMNKMFQERASGSTLIPPNDLFEPIRDKLLASPKVSAVIIDTGVGDEMTGAFQLRVVGCPGWPTDMTHDDFYKAAQFLKRSPNYADLIAAYESDYGGDEEDEAAPEGESFLTRGLVFMLVDIILSSAPKGNTAFYVNDFDGEIGAWQAVHPVPKGLTAGRLMSSGVGRTPVSSRRLDRLSVLDLPPVTTSDDFNEGRRRR